ncbi:hypothetical protein COO60DRAFT_966366 [Scenedesmus sp. NREL 46B-D3]|nr:hypothetical protein COO60DRAFT_966366 [Scenedesmus sp. NREL 46B-D3]
MVSSTHTTTPGFSGHRAPSNLVLSTPLGHTCRPVQHCGDGVDARRITSHASVGPHRCNAGLIHTLPPLKLAAHIGQSALARAAACLPQELACLQSLACSCGSKPAKVACLRIAMGPALQVLLDPKAGLVKDHRQSQRKSQCCTIHNCQHWQGDCAMHQPHRPKTAGLKPVLAAASCVKRVVPAAADHCSCSETDCSSTSGGRRHAALVREAEPGSQRHNCQQHLQGTATPTSRAPPTITVHTMHPSGAHSQRYHNV